LNASKMGCICDKEVLFFGEGSRDTSLLLYLFLTVYRHDLIGLKNRRFCPVKNDRKGKNGLGSPLYAHINTFWKVNSVDSIRLPISTYYSIYTSGDLDIDNIFCSNTFLVYCLLNVCILLFPVSRGGGSLGTHNMIRQNSLHWNGCRRN
jgi:hypothetical protein